VRRPALLWSTVGDDGHTHLCGYDLAVYIRENSNSSGFGMDSYEVWARVHGKKTRDEALATGEEMILRAVRQEIKSLQALETELQSAINKTKGVSA
jgi:hypothetical protein